jgi:deazaflavin-dependent oxidoreductase (nitroreductase family)
MYLDDGDRFVVVASNSGFDPPPAWLLNLQSSPSATFAPAGRTIAVRARVADADERAELWPRLVAHNPLWAAYQSCTTRQTAVVVLERVG